MSYHHNVYWKPSKTMAELVPSCTSQHWFIWRKLCKRNWQEKGYVRKERLKSIWSRLLRFSKDLSRYFLHSQIVHFTAIYSFPPKKKKNTCIMSREQQKNIEIQMLILSNKNHSSTKLQIATSCLPTVVYMISGNHS